MEKVKIANILIDNTSMNEFLNDLQKGVVFTPNVDHIMTLQQDEEFYKIYQEADYFVCDSKIIQVASRLLSVPIKEKISGSDLFPAFYKLHKNNEEVKIFLLGAGEGVAKKAAEKINMRVNREIVIGSISPSFGFEMNEEESLDIIKTINDSKATVLAVGAGSPKQEKWIMKYKGQMPVVKIFLAIGASIDFEAGTVKRAPKWMSDNGLEWLYRLLSEPKRLWKRYLINDLPFFLLIIKQKLGWYKNPWKDGCEK